MHILCGILLFALTISHKARPHSISQDAAEIKDEEQFGENGKEKGEEAKMYGKEEHADACMSGIKKEEATDIERKRAEGHVFLEDVEEDCGGGAVGGSGSVERDEGRVHMDEYLDSGAETDVEKKRAEGHVFLEDMEGDGAEAAGGSGNVKKDEGRMYLDEYLDSGEETDADGKEVEGHVFLEDMEGDGGDAAVLLC